MIWKTEKNFVCSFFFAGIEKERERKTLLRLPLLVMRKIWARAMFTEKEKKYVDKCVFYSKLIFNYIAIAKSLFTSHSKYREEWEWANKCLEEKKYVEMKRRGKKRVCSRLPKPILYFLFSQCERHAKREWGELRRTNKQKWTEQTAHTQLGVWSIWD